MRGWGKEWMKIFMNAMMKVSMNELMKEWIVNKWNKK